MAPPWPEGAHDPSNAERGGMIAVDWGTSTLRAFQLDAEGAWVARTAAARGLAIIGRAAGWR